MTFKNSQVSKRKLGDNCKELIKENNQLVDEEDKDLKHDGVGAKEENKLIGTIRDKLVNVDDNLADKKDENKKYNSG